MPISSFPVKSSPLRRQRLPNGIARQRLRVGMPPEILAVVQQMADEQMRSVSAMVTVLVADHLQHIGKLADAATQAHSTSVERA